MRRVAGTRAEDCELNVRPQRWTADSECPERISGSGVTCALHLSVVSGSRAGHGLERDGQCASGWRAQGEGASCLSRTKTRASALIADLNVRLYCNGTYAGINDGQVGYVLGEGRMAIFEAGGCDTKGIFGEIVSRLRFR
jgi:hypothetical protein